MPRVRTQRRLEKTFGVLAIAGGTSIIAAVALRVELGPLVLVLVNAIVLAWIVYYFAFRPAALRAARVTTEDEAEWVAADLEEGAVDPDELEDEPDAWDEGADDEQD